ncbi:SGNH/GDSL hydrolase family protein [Leptolyngbya sp. FACHB-321]|uniref:SGNH/GDSL hydrolase family protein n=1 Tax=Leptolyngbya sp. FACHB-321 TaxID=2692807 RepID=UPI001689124C|nr:SGNH/GDSL hydrolase family protein [Leptolyngbya sp. FACHB-321]MBD2033714.1 SGNH/GDSL hydrolase family protein [Leptolyngbya sp. FACHB-321]
MTPFQPKRRQLVYTVGGALALTLLGCNQREQAMITLYTFGDSILDCGHYNEFGVHPGQLLVQNDDRLFPDFKGQDLASRSSARLEHRAYDGATVTRLPAQTQGLRVEGTALALITVGGNDLLQGLIQDTGAGITTFATALDTFVQQLPIRPVLLGNVYDPTLGDDSRNFSGVDPAIARKNLQRMNTAIQQIATRYGQLVDLHAHFLQGDPSWFTATIEPSLRGASEIRRAFLPFVLS